MKLYKLTINGFRKLKNVEVYFGDTTFLIGENNMGKSTILSALKYVLSDEKMDLHQFSCETSEDGTETRCEKVELTIEFRDVPADIVAHRGFNSKRLIPYDAKDSGESGLSIVYRKTYTNGSKPITEMMLNKQTLKPEFDKCKTANDFIDNGIDYDLVTGFLGTDLTKNIKPKDKSDFLEIVNEAWIVDDTNTEWINNPGGIVGNVLSKLPAFLLIPANNKLDELNEKNGALTAIMEELFKDVRNSSQNYKEAQKYLNLLAEELNPADTSTELGAMMGELNNIIDSVFPKVKLNTSAELSDPNSVLKPTFNINMESNVSTPVEYQGTGTVRAAIFSLLRYKKQREHKKGDYKRDLIIGFEEPEIYLHPNAANKMRDTIYELAINNSQIICTTHSPYMIDLSRKPKLVLNSCSIKDDGFVLVSGLNVSDEFNRLSSDDRSYIKMLQKIDDYTARIFFAKRVLIVEGDTDEIALKRSIELMPSDIKEQITSDYQIIKARGKAAIISLVNYLRAMNISLFVVHDSDNGVAGAEKFNQPIEDAVGDASNILRMNNCIEDELGYDAPTSDKPYRAYKHMQGWKNWDEVPENWKSKLRTIFSIEGL